MRRSKYRWFIASLIFFITLVNFVDRSAISFVIGPLKEEFHFTDTQFGMILSAFAVGYLFLTVYGGYLVDRWGARVVWPLAATAWSICVGLLGIAIGFWSFIGIRLLLGISEGPHFPAITHTIGRWLSPMERARALSISLVAIPLSAVVGSPICSYLVADFGWRAMFGIISLSGIIWSVIWYFCYRDKPKDCKYVNEEEVKHIETPSLMEVEKKKSFVGWRYIIFHPVLLTNNLAYFAFGYMLFFATLWLPGYFLSQHNLNLKSVGWYLTIPWLVGALFLKVGGFITDYLYKKTGSGRLSRSHVIWVSQALAAVFFVLLGFTNTLGMSILFLSLGLGFGLLPQPAFFSVNIDVAKDRSGTAQGLTSSFLSAAGIVAPIMTGWLIDLTGTYRAAFLLLAAFTALSVIGVIFFHHPDRQWSLKPVAAKN